MEHYVKVNEDGSNLSGFLGDTWHILEEFLEFKSNVTSEADFDKGMARTSENQADVFLAAAVHFSGLTGIAFSQQYFWTWYYLYFKQPEGKPTMYVHFSVFSWEVWYKFILLYLILTVVLWLTCKTLKKVSKKIEIILSPLTYFMGVISAFMNTGYDLRLRSCSARMIIFVALIFGLFCYYALCAGLVARLAVLDRRMPFKELYEVAEKKTHFMCIRNVSFVFNNFTDKRKVIRPEWKDILNTEACPDMRDHQAILKFICKENTAIFENRILMSGTLSNRHLPCDVAHLPFRYFRIGNYITMSKKFKGRKTLKALLTKMKSAGILRKLENKWIKPDRAGSPAQTGVNQITFYHVMGLVLIYFSMALFSLVLLVLEIVYKRYWETIH